MTTQRLQALAGCETAEMRRVAERESVTTAVLMNALAEGSVVIPANPRHKMLDAQGIGSALRTKVNANIGTSIGSPGIEYEMKKLSTALEAGADAVMDLSSSNTDDIIEMRRRVVALSPVPVGTVPVYEVAVQAREKQGRAIDFGIDDLFRAVQRQAEDGVDFITVHCGLTREAVERLKNQTRVAGIVSRGGALIAAWMCHNRKENPLYEYYDRLLEIAREYDVTLSLGDALRPGCTADATDRAQMQELIILGELVQRAWDKGVQVMVEGPGHVPLDQIETNVRIQKSVCRDAPFYVLGPLVTDIALGYDHITSAIGGALAAYYGADFLCYVTPSEHLGLPTPRDVRQGVIASRIAAHAADVARRVGGACERDHALSEARRNLDWKTQVEMAIDPVRARQMRRARNPEYTDECSMCGEYCALRVFRQYVE